MRCQYVRLFPNPVHFDFFMHAPTASQCEREAIPGMIHCKEHATKREMDIYQKRASREARENDNRDR